MSFRLIGFDVEVHPSFWLTIGFFGLLSYGTELAGVLLFVLIAFVSVLIHELGHAIAIRRHGVQPDISLHGMGGTTSWRMVLPLSRADRIIISLAGPFAGFGLAAIAYGVIAAAQAGGVGAPHAVLQVLHLAMWLNIFWSCINLLPVLPFDGGHVLEQALGPKRERLTALISMLVGLTVALYSLYSGMIFIGMLFGFSAYQSYQRFRSEEAVPAARAHSQPPPPARAAQLSEIDPRAAALIQRARNALAEDRPAEAVELAEQVLAGFESDEGEHTPASPLATRQALEIVSWAHVAEGRPDEAGKVHAAICNIGEPDPALTGAIFFAKGQLKDARKVFEAARAEGDDRKEIVGPLIQILIQQGEVGRAAATAFDIIDSLSSEDARHLAQIAFDARSYDWAARLWEAMFERERLAEDAYEAARAHAQDGATDRSLELLKTAVNAGFTDGARAWSDAALEALRGEDKLGTVLPRP